MVLFDVKIRKVFFNFKCYNLYITPSEVLHAQGEVLHEMRQGVTRGVTRGVTWVLHAKILDFCIKIDLTLMLCK